jgi:hypothetical protein
MGECIIIYILQKMLEKFGKTRNKKIPINDLSWALNNKEKYYYD